MIEKTLANLPPAFACSIRVIDGERVIYRKIGDAYEIEVSGLDNKRKSLKADIYVWALNPGPHIVEEIFDIRTESRLADTIAELLQKYGQA